MSGFLSTVARGIGIVGIEMKASLILLLIKLPLSYFLIASYGVQGAAVAVLMAVTVSQYYFLSRFVRMVGTIELSQMMSFASKLMFATMTCSLLFWYGHQHLPSPLFTDRVVGWVILVLEMFLYYVVFGLCLLLVKGFVISDVRVIFESLRRES